MTRLHRFELPGNGISILPPDLTTLMPHLRDVIMADNRIRHVPLRLFQHNPRLSSIDFSGNLLTTIDMNVIMYSDQFFRIYLQGNLIIERFSKNLTDRLDELVHRISTLWMVDILGNPLECSCDTKAFQAWVRNSTIIANVKNLTCGGES